MSLTLSEDILQITTDPSTGSPFLTQRDIKQSRIVFLDKYHNGPFYDRWGMLSGLPSISMSELGSLPPSKIVIPLPGGSNPMWAGDWVDISCNDSAILNGFRSRVLDQYKISHKASKHKQLRLVFISLVHLDRHISALTTRFPEIKIEVIDFASDTELQGVA